MAPPRIDVHAHFLPPSYRQQCQENGHSHPDGMPGVPVSSRPPFPWVYEVSTTLSAHTDNLQQWSPEAHLSLMTKLNIQRSYLSISSPGVCLSPSNPALTAQIAREVNSYAAFLKRTHPSKFGYFASLPLPDIAASLAELDTAFAEGADGVALLTNTAGHYLGDAVFSPLFSELDRRGAVLFIHPTTPCSRSCSDEPTPAAPLHPHYPNPMFEFFFDTARMLTHLFLSGTVTRHPRIRFVIPHCGGAFPPLLSRVTGFSTLVPGPWTGVAEAQARRALGEQFWFDLAGFPFPGQLRGLLEAGVGRERLLYGSDFPFTREEGVVMLAGVMDQGCGELFGEGGVEKVYAGNARSLFGVTAPTEDPGEVNGDEGRV